MTFFTFALLLLAPAFASNDKVTAGEFIVDPPTLPNVNDNFTGRAPDLGALESGRPVPHYGPR